MLRLVMLLFGRLEVLQLLLFMLTVVRAPTPARTVCMVRDAMR